MLLSAVYFLSGILLVQQWAQLPDLSGFLIISLCLSVLLVVAVYCRFRMAFRQVIKALLLFFVGISWALFFAQHALQYRLPESLAAKTIKVQGKITGIPQHEKHAERFYLQVEKFVPLHRSSFKLIHPPRKIQLSWYNSKKHPVRAVHAGEVWQFMVRLKPPHGFFNPGGFDYEGWLFAHGVDARGYIRPASQGAVWQNQRLHAASAFSVDALREKISRSIGQWLSSTSPAGSQAGFHANTQTAAMQGLVTALAVGERHNIQTQQWQDLLHTGTNHLMAISGLHIGLAYLFGYLFGRWLFAMLLPSGWLQRLPAQYSGIVLGLGVAVLYALLAGLSIPTQRALIMLVSFALATLLKRHFRSTDALGLALFLILVRDPLSVLSPGFWFSFIAVAVIFYTLTDHHAVSFSLAGEVDQPNYQQSHQQSLWQRLRGKIQLWIKLQWMITLALFPLSLYLFQQSSLIAPVANLILVPYVSFLVVPFVLVALFFYPFLPGVSELAVQLAASLLQWIWPFIHGLADLPFAWFSQGGIAWWQMTPAMLAILVWLVPLRYMRMSGKIPPWSVRLMMVMLLSMPLLVSLIRQTRMTTIAAGGFKLTVLDVGQGLASVIQTAHHTLVFDSGPKLGAHLDAGTAVVVPYLRGNGIHHLDELVISHGDSDHIGGAASIITAYATTRLMGQDLQTLSATRKTACNQRLHWDWDGVNFQFLSPPYSPMAVVSSIKRGLHKRRNNHSCVLKIAAVGGSALFTGDIETVVEKRLLKTQASHLSADVLVVPHHGSKTSSSPAFIRAVHPQIAIVPAGYRNRYRLPNHKVIKRYLQAHSRLFETGLSGAVSMIFTPDKGLTAVDAYRQSHHHYWNAVFNRQIQ